MLVLPQLLSYPSVNPAMVLADGCNLLHAAVDLLAADESACGADHIAVLINAVRQRLQPADFLADPVSGRMPLDLQFVEHCSPDGLTALYKVGGLAAAFLTLVLHTAVLLLTAGAAAGWDCCSWLCWSLAAGRLQLSTCKAAWCVQPDCAAASPLRGAPIPYLTN